MCTVSAVKGSSGIHPRATHRGLSFFADPARRATLEAAARVWPSRLRVTFPSTQAMGYEP